MSSDLQTVAWIQDCLLHKICQERVHIQGWLSLYAQLRK